MPFDYFIVNPKLYFTGILSLMIYHMTVAALHAQQQQLTKIVSCLCCRYIEAAFLMML
jgi:hypothetical protein